jgi:hypothetical protein
MHSLWTWPIGHEIGHIAHRHSGVHTVPSLLAKRGNESTRIAAVKALSGERNEELEADMFSVEVYEELSKKGDLFAGITFRMVTASIVMIEGGRMMVEQGKGETMGDLLHSDARLEVQWPKNESHPPVFLRLAQMAHLLHNLTWDSVNPGDQADVAGLILKKLDVRFVENNQ